jgi:hypothetical protein
VRIARNPKTKNSGRCPATTATKAHKENRIAKNKDVLALIYNTLEFLAGLLMVALYVF